MIKKIFIISTVIFVLAGGFFLIQKFILNPQQPSQEEEGLSLIDEKIKEVSEEKIENESADKNKRLKVIAEGKIISAEIDKKSNEIYYYNSSNFLQADVSGSNPKVAAAYPVGQVKKVQWSKNKKKAVVENESGIYLFDIEEKQLMPYRSGMDTIIWNTFRDGQIIYKYFDEKAKKRSLNVADENGSNWKEIMEFNFRDVSLEQREGSETLLVFPQPDALVKTQLWVVDLMKNEQKKILEDKEGADFLWSPDGSKILASFTQSGDKSKLFLSVMNKDGGQMKGLNNFPTTVKKCAWSKDNVTVYCAWMNSIPSQAVMPNDWQNGTYNSSDTFWKIDTESGKMTRIAEIADLTEYSQNIDSVNLFLDSQERYLFFIDRLSSNLFRIKLDS